MSKRANISVWNRNAARISSHRLTLAEFSDLVHPYVEAIRSKQDKLTTFRELFSSRERIWDSDCEATIESLTDVCRACRELHTCIVRSDHFPLSVVPLRFTLLSMLDDVEAQIFELNQLIVALSLDSQVALDQSAQQVFEIKDKLIVLESKYKEVLTEIAILLDRARFKEREYNIA